MRMVMVVMMYVVVCMVMVMTVFMIVVMVMFMFVTVMMVMLMFVVVCMIMDDLLHAVDQHVDARPCNPAAFLFCQAHLHIRNPGSMKPLYKRFLLRQEFYQRSREHIARRTHLTLKIQCLHVHSSFYACATPSSVTSTLRNAITKGGTITRCSIIPGIALINAPARNSSNVNALPEIP